MVVKQLTYTNLDNGWGIDRVEGSVSGKERDAFAGLCTASNISEPIYAFDINKGYYVLSYCSPYGTDTFGRPRTYTHGYLLSMTDADMLFKNSGVLLGIDYFVSNTQDKLVPLKENLAEFKEKFSADEYAELTECVYEAVTSRKSLEILSGETDRIHFIKKVMNTVYDYFPLSLKKFITFSTNASGRTVNAVSAFSRNADITYDFVNKKAQGITGFCSEFVKMLFTDKKDYYLTQLEKKLFVHTDREVAEKSFYSKMFDTVLSESTIVNTNEKSSLVEKLIEIIQKTDLSIEKNALLASEVIRGIASEKTVCADALYKRLFELFKTVNNESFKDSVAELFCQRYCDSCTQEKYKALYEYFANEKEFFVRTAEKGILKGETSFIELCAENVLEDAVYGEFIKKQFDKKCTEYISAVISQKITEDPTEQILDRTICSVFHEDVVNWLLKLKTDKEIMWKYFSSVYSSKKNFESYFGLESSIFEDCEETFHNIADGKTVECVLFLKTAYQNIGKAGYIHIADNLKGSEAVEHFYKDILLSEAKNCEQIENLKNELLRFGFKADLFTKAALGKYAELCFNAENKKKTQVLDALNRIKVFAEGIDITEIGGIDVIKEAFWKQFKFGKLSDITDDVRYMSIPGNSVSDFANSVLNLYMYILGEAESFSELDFKICKQNLCTKESVLRINERSKLLKQLKKLFYKHEPEYDIDFYILINYSPITRKVDFKKAIITLNEVEEYMQKKDSMLDVRGVYNSLFKYVERKAERKKKSDIRASFEYTYLLMCMKKESVNAIDAVNHFYKGNAKAFYMFLYGIFTMIGALVLHFLSKGSLMAGYTTAIAFSITQMVYMKYCADKKRLHKLLAVIISGVIILIYGLYFMIF